MRKDCYKRVPFFFFSFSFSVGSLESVASVPSLFSSGDSESASLDFDEEKLKPPINVANVAPKLRLRVSVLFGALLPALVHG